MPKVAETYGSLVGNPSADVWLGELAITNRLYKESISPASHMTNQKHAWTGSVLKQKDHLLGIVYATTFSGKELQ